MKQKETELDKLKEKLRETISVFELWDEDLKSYQCYWAYTHDHKIDEAVESILEVLVKDDYFLNHYAVPAIKLKEFSASK